MGIIPPEEECSYFYISLPHLPTKSLEIFVHFCSYENLNFHSKDLWCVSPAIYMNSFSQFLFDVLLMVRIDI